MSRWVDLGLLTDPREPPRPLAKAESPRCTSCGTPHIRARGLCDRCYQRVQRGDPLGDDLLPCAGCGRKYQLGPGHTRQVCASCRAKRGQKVAS
jgi:hypothetical protein